MSAELKVQFRLIARGKHGVYTSPDKYDSVDAAMALMLSLNAARTDEVVWGIETVTTLVHDWTGVGA